MKLCIRHIITLIIASFISFTANADMSHPASSNFSDVFATTTDRYQYSGKELDRMNGLGHALWQATITSEFGYDVALQAGNAHEANPSTDISIRVFANLNNADETVDLLNNIIGRNIGQKNLNKDMKTLAVLILEEFKNNGLYVATQIDNSWIINKSKLSEAKYNELYNIFMNLNKNGFTPSEQKHYDLKKEQELERLQITWGTMK